MSASPDSLACLRSLLADRFPEKARARGQGRVPTGVPPVDEVLAGGLAPGRIVELVSGAPSSGGQLVLVRLIGATRAARRRMALVDGGAGLAPEELAGDAAAHLVWVRCADPERTLAAADLLVRDANYAVVAVDLRGLSGRQLRRIPATHWWRLQRAAAGGAAVLVQTPFPLIPCAWARLILGTAAAACALTRDRDGVATGLEVRVERMQTGGEALTA